MDSKEYQDYMKNLKEFMREMGGKRFVSKYTYNLDDDGNYVKTSKDAKNIKNNMIITPPKYVNIEEQIKINNNQIKVLSVEYKKLRGDIINGAQKLDGKFNEVRDKIVELNDENLFLLNMSKIHDEKEIETIKEENFRLKNSQHNLMINIKSLVNSKTSEEQLKELVLEYIKNNEDIMKNYKKINTIMGNSRKFYFEDKPKVSGKIPKKILKVKKSRKKKTPLKKNQMSKQKNQMSNQNQL